METEGRGEGESNGGNSADIDALPCVKQMAEAAPEHKGLSLVLRDDLEVWEEGCGRQAQQGVDICILVAASCCCTIETNTTL